MILYLGCLTETFLESRLHPGEEVVFDDDAIGYADRGNEWHESLTVDPHGRGCLGNRVAFVAWISLFHPVILPPRIACQILVKPVYSRP